MPGVGQSLEAKRVEMRMVTRDDGIHVTSSRETVKDDWGWGDEEEEEEAEPVTRSRASFEEERRASSISISPDAADLQVDEEDAWGWGDEVAVESPTDARSTPIPATLSPIKSHHSAEKRNVTLSEKYWISSIPSTIFSHIVSIYEDGAKLMQPEYVFNFYAKKPVGANSTKLRKSSGVTCCWWLVQYPDFDTSNVSCGISLLLFR